MRNYLDPKMSITMFDAENVVTDPSGLVGAAQEQYFNGGNGVAGTLANATVATKNILNFTETK